MGETGREATGLHVIALVGHSGGDVEYVSEA